MILQLLFVLAAIIVGARLGGIGLGVMGGVGMAILVFIFGLEPTTPPIDVMLMIAAVISAAAAMQAAGGLDYLVRLAEKLLRKNPSQVTIISPLVTYIFTFVAGTGHVAYSVLPVIAEVARETKIRPERPLGIAVIASQQAITASPISAATVALLGLLTGFDITLFDILKVTIPATLVGVLIGAFLSKKVGKELLEDPEYLRRVEKGMIKENSLKFNEIKKPFSAKLSVILFLVATVLIVLFGSIPAMRPSFNGVAVDMPAIIEILHAFRLCHYPSDDKDRRYRSYTGKRVYCGNAGSDSHLWYRMDGRHFHQWKPRCDNRFNQRYCDRNAVALRSRIICNVDSSL